MPSIPPRRLAPLPLAVMLLSLAGCTEGAVFDSEQCLDTCDTAAGEWSPSERLAHRRSDSPQDPQLAISDDGTALAIWEEEYSGDYNLRFSLLDATTGEWTQSDRLPHRSSDSPQDPQLVITNDGTALAVWEEEYSGDYDLRFSVFEFSTGVWSQSERLANRSSDSPQDVELAITNDGNALAVWEEEYSGDYDLRFSVFDFASKKWSQSERLANRDSDSRQDPQLAATDDGSALLIWEEKFGGDYDLRFSVFDVATGLWTQSERLANRDSDARQDPQLAVTEDGAAMAVWEEKFGGDFDLRFSVFDFATGSWTQSERLANRDSDSKQDPQLVLTDNGTALAVWEEKFAWDFDLRFSVFDFASGTWTQSKRLANRGSDSRQSPKLAVTDDGIALAIWEEEFSGDYDLRFSVLNATTGEWAPSERLAHRRSDSPQDPQLAIADDGTALAIWEEEYSGDYDLRFSTLVF